MSPSRLPLLLTVFLLITSVVGVIMFADYTRKTNSALPVQSPFPTSLAEINTQSRAPDLNIQTWQTKAGTKVLFLPTHQLPMVDVRLIFNAGGARDGELAGLARLTNAMLNQGTQQLDVNALAEAFENIGAELSLDSHRDMAITSLTTLTDTTLLNQALLLFEQVLSEPIFPKDNFERLRTRTLQQLKMQLQTPGPQLNRAFQTALFKQHPYGSAILGTEESLNQINTDALRDFYQTYYTAANATLAIVGNVTLEQAQAISEKLTTALPKGPAAPKLEHAQVQPASHEHIVFDSSQTHIILGNQVIGREHPDYIPLYVGNHVLGGGSFSAILMDEVRQQRGLVYGIYSNISPMAAASPFTVQLQTANENKDKALALTLELLQQFIDNGPTDAQVALAINDLAGSFALSTASNGALVGQLGLIGFYDLPLDYLANLHRGFQQVSAQDIQSAFAKHLDPQKLVITSIGPEAPKWEQ